MIALLLSWTIIAATFYTFGRAFLQLWHYITKRETSASPLDVILIGMCITTSIIGVFSLLMPANTMLLFALGFMCILYWYVDNKNIPSIGNGVFDFLAKQPRWHFVVYAVLIVSIAMFCTLHPMMTDTLYYHYQNLMWNDQYAIVPGLGNLQPRLAFNSNYFLLASTFGMRPFFNQFIFGVHTFFLVAIYVWVIYKTLNSKDVIKSTVAILMLTCLFVIYKNHITSVTTDFIPNLLIAYLILKTIFDREAVLKNPILYFLLPLFIVTLKLSCFAIIILPLYVLWLQIKKKEYKHLTLSIVSGLIIIVPWCVRTVILSGYLIFPFPMIDLFDVDWKVPLDYAIEQKEFIQAFAKYPNNLDIKAILSMPISEWFPVWWNSDMQYYNPIANRVFSILTLVAIPIALFLTFTRKKSENNILILIWNASLLAIVVWFFNAPDFRFIYSFILALLFIAVLLLLERVNYLEIISRKAEQFNFNIVLTIITITFVSLYSGRWVYHQKGESLLDLVKVPTSIAYTRTKKGAPAPDQYYSVEVNGVKIYRKSGSERDLLCFDCILPCSADYVGGIEMRGETLQEGFRCSPDAPHRLTY